MKIRKISISWFRGAASPAELDLKLKSLVIYGENGAGKSSFVDSVEYIVNGGKINHLSHEYSGKRQEKAVINTHMPDGQNGEISITLENDSIARSLSENSVFSGD